MNNPPTSQKGMSSQNESTQAFAKLPKVFFNEEAPQYPQYKHLTAQHILAYTLMRDRLQLSIIKQMQDENGTPFICYDLRNVAADVRCGEKKAGQLVNDLDNMGLIHKVRQGLGKPNRIYVHDVLETEPSKRLDRTRSKDGQEPQEEQLKSCQENIAEPSNGQTRPVGGTVPEQSNGQSNKTDKNNTEMNETYPFNSEETDGMSQREQLEEYFSQSLEVDLLLWLCLDDEDTIYQIVDLLVDTCATNRKTLRIAGDDKPAEVVRSRFMKLNADHIRFVLKCLAENSSPIRNMKQYLLASLYNAPTTMQLSYQNQTNHDLAMRR